MDENKLFETPTGNKYRQQINEEYEKKYALLLAMQKEKCSKSLYLLNKYVLKVAEGDEKFVPLAPFHKTLCNFIQDRPDKKKLVLIPRGHLKTKLITVGYPILKIIQNPKSRTLIYSATWQTAVDIQQGIQKTMQTSERLNEIWGDIFANPSEWSQDRTRLRDNDKREPTITAAGIDNNLVGGHYDLIIMDDPVNRDNIATQDQIEKVIQRYKDSLDLLEPNGELIVIGTRWHDSDLYGWILEPGNGIKDNYEVMIKKAYEGNLDTGEDFVPLWPDKFSKEELQRRLKEEGWYHFSAQYLNNPVPEENASFKREHFRYYDDTDIRGMNLNKFVLIDPAMTVSKESDYTAMVVIGVDEFSQIFILDIVRRKLSPSELIDMIFFLREKWMPHDVAIETTAFQKTLAYSLRDDSRYKRRPFHVTELKTNDRNKEQRIRGLQPLYENAKVFHNKLLPNNVYLEDELIRFPRSQHDDIIDALAYSLDIIYPSRQPAKERSTHRKWMY